MKISVLRSYIKFRKWGKYIIVLVVFFVIYLFVGDHSVVQFVHRRTEIKQYEQQTRQYKRMIKEAKQMNEDLQTKEGAERYAREHYLMHEESKELKEDVFLIDE